MIDDIDIPDIVRRVKNNEKRKTDRERKMGVMTSGINDRNWDSEPVDTDVRNENFLGVENRKEYFLAASSLNDHYISKIIDARTRQNQTTVLRKETLISDFNSWTKFIRSNFSNYQLIEFSTYAGMLIERSTLCFFDYSVNSNTVIVKIYGDEKYIETISSFLTKEFVAASCYIEWVYNPDGSSINIPLLEERLPVTEMYPFLGKETIEEYYDRYINSSASILLLIGPPGTGKTSFIRGLLHHTKKSAIVTYDEKILDRDYVFARFLEDDVGFMVIEDADNFLKSRKDGNGMMHRFLSVGDGLVSMKGKKLVFSTNLPSIRDIDEALVRPGRCFDILNFDNYTLEEAEKLAKVMNINFKKKENASDTYSLAEVFHEQVTTNVKDTKNTTKFGFI